MNQRKLTVEIHMETKPMKILVAVDGSEASLVAAAEAGMMPWPKNSIIKIVSVSDTPTPATPWLMPLPSGTYATWEKIFEDRATASLSAALSRFNEMNQARDVVMTKVLHGPVKEVILEESEQWQADLVILGTHGYNLLERVWLGSVSRGVTAHAHCSVRVVRPVADPEAEKDGKHLRILLAIDGSEFSQAAVDAVATRPWPAGTEVRIVSVLHLPFTPSPETWSLPDSFYYELEKQGRETLNAAILRGKDRLQQSQSERETPLEISSVLLLGHAEEELIREAKRWGAHLIVAGSHGLSGWKRFLLGSVSQALIAHAPCSVEVVRPPARER
jgi:nucleotide-binding universal stress UspA family protein